MSEPKPVRFQWTDDGVMKPHPRAEMLCDRQFTVGEWYVLVVHEERSEESHRHYFACIREAWQNLPPPLDTRWPSPEHLRKWALVQAGYCNEQAIALHSHKDALEVAALSRRLDHYAVIKVNGDVCRIWTAHSQSRRAMNKQRFQESKEAVLRIISEIIGTDAATLAANAGKAA